MRLVFVNGTKITNSVFSSHVLEYLRLVRERKPDWEIDFVTIWHRKVHERTLHQTLAKINEITQGRSYYFREPPIYFGLRGVVNALGKELEKLLLKEDKQEKILIESNSYLMLYSLLSWKQRNNERLKGKGVALNVLGDLKGILPPEELHYEGGILPRRFLRYLVALKMEKFIIPRCNMLTCVSQRFKELIIEQYGVREEKILVVPSCVNHRLFYFDSEERKRVRKKLGLDKKLAIAYSGSMRRWQMPGKILELLSCIYRREQDVIFLIITRDKRKFEYLLSREGKLMPFHIISLALEEMAPYLMAADVGLLLRERDIVNKVACPTKFAEYLRCGPAIVLTEGIGDLSTMVKEDTGLGYISSLRKEDLENTAEKLLRDKEKLLSEEGKRRRSRLAYECFAWEAGIIDKLLEFMEISFARGR